MDIPALPTHFDQAKGGMVEFGDDSKLFVKFETRSVLDPIKTQDQGCAVHVAVPYVHIQQPGERDCTIRPATQLDQRRFRHQWQQYLDGRTEDPSGTPLSLLFPLNPEIVDNLKYFKISSIQQLAGLNDTQVQNIGMGGMMFREKAQTYLSAADKGKDFHTLAKSVEQMKLEMQARDTKIAALEQALAEAESEDETPRKKRGRPPNAVAA